MTDALPRLTEKGAEYLRGRFGGNFPYYFRFFTPVWPVRNAFVEKGRTYKKTLFLSTKILEILT